MLGEMGPLYETSTMGMWIKVYADRVEFKRKPLLHPIESVPLGQIASIKVGSAWKNTITIETTGGKEYEIPTGDKTNVADAIYAAQAETRASTAVPVSAVGVADEVEKLAGLRDRGVLSPEEFDRQKAVLLSGSHPRPKRTVAPAPKPSSPTLRKLKIVVLVVLGLLVAMIALGFAVGPEKKSADATEAAPAPSLDDAGRLIAACGKPDEEIDTSRDNPPPPIPSRMITYRKARLMFAYIPGGGAKLGDPPPYRWKYLGPKDTTTNKVVSGNLRAVLEKRLPCALSTRLADEP